MIYRCILIFSKFLERIGFRKKVYIKSTDFEIKLQNFIYKVFIGKKANYKRLSILIKFFKVMSDMVVFIFIILNIILLLLNENIVLLYKFLIFLLTIWIFCHIIKLFIYKPRPYVVYDVRSYSYTLDGNSFPGAHAAVSFFMILFNPQLNVYLILVPIFRILGFEHFLFDTIVGTIIGIFFYFLLTFI